MSATDLADVVRQCGRQFRAYEQQHLAKATEEANEKAATNRRYAELCESALKASPLHVGQSVKVYSQRWTRKGWEPCEEIGVVIDPCVKDDDVYAGDVEVKIEGVLNRVFTSRATVEPLEAPAAWYTGFIEALEREQRADQTIVAFFHPDCSWDVWVAEVSEEILKWGYRAADEERAREVERGAKELSYAFASDTMGDHINVWWASLDEKDRAKCIASVRAALRGRHA